MKKSEVLQQLQEYLRIGARTITKLELNLVVAERHIRKLEASEHEQELLIANETINKLNNEIKELKKNPHAANNASERAIESVLHNITTCEPLFASVHLGTIEKFKNNWGEAGNAEQKKAYIKYKDQLERAKPYLIYLKNQWIKEMGLEKIMKDREAQGKKF